MGGVKDFIFGKKPKPEKSEAGNHAYDDISGAFKPALGFVGNAGNQAWDILKGGPQGFADSGGFDFLMNSMQKGVTSSKAAQGLLKSGSYGTALQDRAFGLGSTYLSQYMDQLFKLGNLGIGAGGVLSDSGKWSKGTGQQAGKSGALPMILQAGAAIAGCDPLLKEDIVFVGTRPDGLNEYEFTYRDDAPIVLPKGRFRGVMADEVAELYPELLGDPVRGFMTVKEELRPERID